MIRTEYRSLSGHLKRERDCKLKSSCLMSNAVEFNEFNLTNFD